MYKKNMLTALILTFAVFAACSPNTVDETANEADPSEDALRRVTEVADSVSDESSTPINAEAIEVIEDSISPVIDESLPRLPAFMGSGSGGGIPSELPPASQGEGAAALDLENGVAGSVLIDPFGMFAETDFVLAADLPEAPAGQIAIERVRSSMTVELARQIATDFQFPDQLYQQQLPLDVMDDVRIGADGTFVDQPFVVFDSGRQLVISSGSIWISYGAAQSLGEAAFDVNNFSREELIAQTEALLATYSFIDFEYTLQAEPFGNVLVIPSYEGVSANSPLMGFYYTPDQSGSSVLASLYMDLYSNINVVGDYPILSSESAWQALEPGLETGMINWYFNDLPIPVEPDLQTSEYIQPQFWFPTHDVETAVSLYGYPTVYNPIGQDDLPIIVLEDTVIRGPTEIGMMLATSESGLFKFTGRYASTEAGGHVFEAEGVVPLGYEDQLFIQGVVIREGDQLFIDSEETGRVQLINAPADLPEGLDLFVNGYRNGETADGIPLIDWQYLDEVVDYGEFPIAEPLPVDGDGGIGFAETGFGSITINFIELGYGVSWPQPQFDEETGIYQPVTSDYLIPIWRFVGQTADGVEITFEVPAVDQGYFDQN